MNLCNLQNGRPAAIFFLFFITYLESAFANGIYANVDFAINQGLLTEEYWRNQSLQTSSNNVLAYTDRMTGGNLNIGSYEVFAGRRKISTISTNHNSLVVAANADRVLTQGKDGTYHLFASVKKFDYDVIGTHIDGQWDAINMTWSISPQLLNLKSFSIADGNGSMQLQPNSESVYGEIDKMGTRTFGFTTAPVPIQLGLGASVDLKLNWQFQDIQLTVDAKNIFSKITAQGVFYTNDRYRTNVQSGNLVFSNVPSLTGEYGQKDTTFALPKITHTYLNYHQPDSKWTEHVGVIALEDGLITWAGIDYQRNEFIYSAKTFELKNIYLSIQKAHFLVKNLSLQATLGSAFSSHYQLGMTGLTYTF